MKPRRLLLPLIFLLASCSGSRTLVGPDGTEHHLVSCGAIENCYEEARKDCRGNYNIVNSTSETTTSPNGLLSVQNLLIKCEGEHPVAAVPAPEPAVN